MASIANSFGTFQSTETDRNFSRETPSLLPVEVMASHSISDGFWEFAGFPWRLELHGEVSESRPNWTSTLADLTPETNSVKLSPHHAALLRDVEGAIGKVIIENPDFRVIEITQPSLSAVFAQRDGLSGAELLACYLSHYTDSTKLWTTYRLVPVQRTVSYQSMIPQECNAQNIATRYDAKGRPLLQLAIATEISRLTANVTDNDPASVLRVKGTGAFAGVSYLIQPTPNNANFVVIAMRNEI